MWLSERRKREMPAAMQGRAVAYEKETGVDTDGELRCVSICAPKGYLWRPEDREDVAVIRGEQDELIIVGVEVGDTEGIAPGEVGIKVRGNSIILRKNGDIEITGAKVKVFSPEISLSGNTYIEGGLMINGQPYKPCNCAQEG